MNRPAWAIAVLLAPVLATIHRFRNGFVFDDVFVIERGTFIHDPANLGAAFVSHTMVSSTQEAAFGNPSIDSYRPVTLSTFFVDAAISGRSPWAYHATNLVAHVGATFLLFLVALRVLGERRRTVAYAVALVFGLSPALAEAHVWINGRSDPLAAVFLLGTWLLLQRAFEAEHSPPRTEDDAKHSSRESERFTGAQRGRVWLALAFGTATLALGCKEVVLLALPLLAFSPSSRPVPRERRVTAALTMLGACGLYLILRHSVLSGLRTHTDSTQLVAAIGNAPLLVLDAVAHVVLPLPYHLRSLSEDYAAIGTPIRLLAWIVAAAGIAALVALARRRPLFVLGVLLALATLAPISVITTVLWPGFGRYLYVPAVGITLACADLVCAALDRWPKAWRAIGGAAILQIVASAALLAWATTTFASDERLYRDALEHQHDHAFAAGSLGLLYRRENRCADATPLLERARRRAPNDPRYPLALGHCLVSFGRLSAARAIALEGERQFRNTRVEAGFLMLHSVASPTDDASMHAARFRRCLLLNPGRIDCRHALESLPTN